MLHLGKLNKKIGGSILSFLILAMSVAPVLSSSLPKAVGGIWYDDGIKHFIEFNATQTVEVCNSYWNVTGDYAVAFYVNGGGAYTEFLNLNQLGSSIVGTYLAQTGGIPPWLIDSGNVNGTQLDFTAHYESDPLYTRHFTATINQDGSLTGSWDDLTVSNLTGTWNSMTGHASQITDSSCGGKGIFKYYDNSGANYTVEVSAVKILGKSAWLAGQVISGNTPTNNWIFAKVVDGGEPGVGSDKIWLTFTNESVAKSGVSQMLDPSISSIEVNGGNLQVR